MITVLVVEDDPVVARVHQRVVERVPGFAVIAVAANGAAAIDLVLAERPELVVLDLYLPDISGLEVLRRIRGAGLGTDVIVISAAREAETVREVLRAGAVDYLLKPFRVERLIQSLEQYQSHRDEEPGRGTVSQAEIDRMLGRPSRPESPLAPPKGIDPATLSLVLHALAESEAGLTGDAVAERTGVSRTTAHRYLRYLTATGDLRAEPVYGSVGRPELVYRREEKGR